jgi:ATP-dependent DNA helicase RecG
MNLSDPLSQLKGVGEAQTKKFAALNIHNISDLLDYYPRRYEDYSKLTKLKDLKPGKVSFSAKISSAKGRRLKARMHITEAIADDSSASVRLIWFNQPYRAQAIKADKEYFISGEYKLSRTHFSLINPSIELVSDLPANTARILSVYRENKDISSREIRQAIIQLEPLFSQIKETLPPWLIKKYNLVSRSEALRALHLPETDEDLERAKRRLGFEEVFGLSLASLLNKNEIGHEKSLRIKFEEKLAKSFVASLPFDDITASQRRSVWETYLDMDKTSPMNRLIEGDVGSGKTVVAVMAALMVLKAKKQVAFMAPTELLARQHANTIYKLLKPLKLENEVNLLVGSMNTAQKRQAHSAIKAGKANFIIGTQALIQDKVNMKKLGLVIIDEQHRFGVDQRKALMLKAGHMPHVLSLTATPIPRSLALTLYGELDVSLLKEKPAGRKSIITNIIRPSEIDKVYSHVRQEINDGRQMFVVCPSISQSAVLDIKAAEDVYEHYSKQLFKDKKVGLLHGKLKNEQKTKVMEDFVAGKLDILVATTVIEVGVDVANATIMLIENPERFGLAQLHQLRGRVGRSDHQGHCYLLLDGTDPPSRRLRALVSSNDGFKLAELDLDIRGPGAIYGTAQHGLLDLRIAKLSDVGLIKEAIEASKAFIDKKEDLLNYKQLNAQVNRLRIVTSLN